MAALERRKRLPDGSFGDLEKIFDGETDTEKSNRLEQEKNDVEESLAGLVFQLVEKGVL